MNISEYTDRLNEINAAKAIVQAAKELAMELGIEATTEFLMDSLPRGVKVPHDEGTSEPVDNLEESSEYLTREQVEERLPNENNWRVDTWNFIRLLKRAGLIYTENVKTGFTVSEKAVRDKLIIGEEGNYLYSPAVVDIIMAQLDAEPVQIALKDMPPVSKKAFRSVDRLSTEDGLVHRSLRGLTSDLSAPRNWARRVLENEGYIHRTRASVVKPTVWARSNGSVNQALDLGIDLQSGNKPDKYTYLFSPAVFELLQGKIPA